MTIERSTATDSEAAERRGDDTHWWKAYPLHSTVALALKALGKVRAAGTAALSQSSLAPHRHTGTETHRAADKALECLQKPTDHVDAARY